MNTLPVTPEQYDRYQRRARARVVWGHRASGIVDSLVRKGVQRREAQQIVAGAEGEVRRHLSGQALAYAVAAGIAGLITLLFHSPQVLHGGPVGPFTLDSMGMIVLPLLLVTGVLAVGAVNRFLSALFTRS